MAQPRAIKVDEPGEISLRAEWQKLGFYDLSPKGSKNEENEAFVGDKALRMMQKMGYKEGSGLGKNQQGIIKPIELASQFGKYGLGLNKDTFCTNEAWDFEQENVQVEENLCWLQNESELGLELDEMISFIKEEAAKNTIRDEYNFCEPKCLNDVIKAKEIFNVLDLGALNQARARANPFETIKSVFFMNRAALKLANIDAATEFMFSKIDENPFHINNSGPFYFADICAGPGGFTEYILWRKKWHFKGFGFTLKDENDFKLSNSTCCSPVTFQTLYGLEGDGNICNPENVKDFAEKVLFETGGKGVHFITSDGGFSVDGNEDMQEVLSKNIYIGQCLTALEILRPHGHFVTKLFDIFTPFSVGLLYLMYKCFEKVAILKPNSSRPANSERYFICCNFQKNGESEKVNNFLRVILDKLWTIKDNTELDILELISMDSITSDLRFFKYIFESNNSIAKNQTISLQKLAAFCRNKNLIELRQEELRKSCLEFWKIPDLPKPLAVKCTLQEMLTNCLPLLKPELLLVQPRQINNLQNLKVTISDLKDFHFCLMQCGRITNICNIYVALTNTKTYRLQGTKWARVKNVNLVKGTILYGELVKEQIKLKNTTSPSKIYQLSLHVIDALFLGDTISLIETSFKERLRLIQRYCKAVNHESQNPQIRIRSKKITPLKALTMSEVHKNGTKVHPLKIMGFNSVEESYDVNSLLLLKTNAEQSFYSTYVLRGQVFLSDQNKQENQLTLETIINFIKSNL